MTIFHSIENREFYESFSSKYDKKFICWIDDANVKKYVDSSSGKYGYLSRIVFGICGMKNQ